MLKYARLVSLVPVVLFLMACQSMNNNKQPPAPMIGMANPASTYCIEQKGKLIPKKAENGDEYALCQLPNGQVIEEWQFYRQQHALNK